MSLMAAEVYSAPGSGSTVVTAPGSTYRPPGSAPAPIKTVYSYVPPEARETREAEEAVRRAQSAGLPTWAWATVVLVAVGGYVVWSSRKA